MSTHDTHTRIVELMPWYLNGTLPEHERRLVDEHISECLPCRKAINDERRLRALVTASSSSPDSLEHGLDRLLRRIDRDARAPARPAQYRYGLALAASLAAAAIAFWAMWPIAPSRDGEFATLSSAGDARASRADVVFREGTSPAAVDAVMREIGATVVAGPSAIGRYTIELPDGTAAEAERRLETLRANPDVRLVAPAFAEGEPR